ncbi:MAG: PSD1 and planctomycete cytochrome C domain-containing protein [Limisphaerales bacterium]
MATDVEERRAAITFFEEEVRPILVKRCYDCHSDAKQKGGLRVDHIGYLKAGGENGPALIPGQPAGSALIAAVRYGNADFQMPPKSKLPDAEIAVLEKWIKIGAPWPDEQKVVVTKDGFTQKQRAYWFFQPIAKVAAPDAGGKWTRNDIDRFIAHKHAELKLTPAPEADRRELARRAYFDLHGLPPSTKQLDTFVRDKDPKAYEKLVDELLASPRYGERWAQHWLDLVRYAESDGYNQDAYRPTVWRYRDYVINSFNGDKPYDQFVREQLAGDEIAPDNPETLIATAYLRHPVYEYNLRDVRGQWEVILTDMTDNASEVFLGLSMGCARCHDHKFDPIRQKDYYRLRAFFTPVLWREDLKLATPAQKQAFDEQQVKWETATSEIRSKIDALTSPGIRKKVETWRQSFPKDLQAMTLKPKDRRESLEKQLAGLCERQLKFARAQFKPDRELKSDEAKEEYKALQVELRKFNHLIPKPLMAAFVATDAGQKAPPNFLDTRQGKVDIKPGFPSIIAPDLPTITPTATSTGRRKALADWITRSDNQLATRVIVNRIWQYHFGRGIVGSANDFGILGGRPTHPDLLDHLTAKFVKDGWSFKALHHEIMLSATYRQTARREPDATTSKVDPANHFFWRFHPRRLDAEQTRDAMLAVSGELDLKSGGPSTSTTGNRRSIYTQKKRNRPDELLSALDRPAGFASVSERQSTTTPTQALQLINGDWVLARARKLAARTQDINDAWLAVLGRTPRPREKVTAEAFLEKRIRAAELQDKSSPKAEAPRGQFKINTERERLVVQSGAREGDDFTIEAIANLDSIDVNGETRTLVTRWNGNKRNFGWSIDVTGVKSRYQPRNILMQLVGEDRNGNIGYQIVVSNLRFPLKRRQHLVVQVAGSRREVTFTLHDLEQPGAPAETATVGMDDLTKLGHGDYPIVLGGQSVRRTTRQWNGGIEALRVVPGRIPDDRLRANSDQWQDGLLVWRAKDKPDPRFTWHGSAASAQAKDPRYLAMTDLCQALLNSNEFFYLH